MEAMREKWTDERLDDGFREMRAGFNRLDSRMGGLESRMDGFDSRMDRLESRVEAIDSRLDKMQHTMLQAAFGMAATMATGFIGIAGLIVTTQL